MDDNKIYKETEQIIKIQAENKATLNTNVTVYSYDKNTAKFLFQLTKNNQPISLGDSAVVKIALKFESANGKAVLGSVIEDEIEGIVSIVIPEEYLGYQGSVTGGIYIDYSNGQSLDCGYFKFSMKRSLIDDELGDMPEYYVEGFENLRVEINDKSEEMKNKLADLDSTFKELDVYNKSQIDDKVDELKPAIDNVTAQLGQTITRGNVSVSDIDKNLGKIDQTYVSDELLQQIAGTAPINAVPADHTITLQKIAFNPVLGIPSKNLFNKNAVKLDTFFRTDNGNESVVSGYFTSEFIGIDSNTNYYFYKNNSSIRVGFFTAEKTFISGTDLTGDYISPLNAKYVKVTSTIDFLNTTQIEKGKFFTGYEAFGNKLDQKTVQKESIEGNTLKKNTVDLDRLSGIIPSKNLFNKEVVKSNTFLNLNGVESAVSGYFSSDFTPVEPSTSYYVSGNNSGTRLISFDSTKKVIQGLDGVKKYTTPSNCTFVRLTDTNGYLDTTQVEKGEVFTGYESFNFTIKYLKTESDTVNKKIYTFNDAWVAWLNGEKFPIAFYGDSTVDGVNTTGWIENVLGTDSVSPNTFTKKMQDLLRESTKNSILRIYNAGFGGTKSAFGAASMNAEFGSSAAYADVKMIGIGFGINDRIDYTTEKSFRISFKSNIIKMIDWCYEHNIQPFLLTTQAIISPGISTQHSSYPLRTAEDIETVANEVKRELAVEMGLELIDVNKYTEEFLLYSSLPVNSIISDKLHFGDIGHQYEAGMIYSHLSPWLIFIDKHTKVDYSSQKVVKGVPEDLLTMPTNPIDTFKVFANYTKTNTTDTLIFKSHIFIDGRKKMSLKAFKSDESSLTYVKVNGVITSLDVLEKTIGNLDLGLHKLEVWSGSSEKVDFKGFIIEL